MAKTSAKAPVQVEDVEQLNALVPQSLKRRLKIAAANTGRPMTAMLIDWIEKGLAEVEKPNTASRR